MDKVHIMNGRIISTNKGRRYAYTVKYNKDEPQGI